MRTRTVAISVVFYVAVAALLLGVLFPWWGHVLPGSISHRIAHNTEGYVLALAVAGWIQFARPRLTGSRSEWIVTVLVALAFVGLTVYLLTGPDVASRFKTLNEGTLAAALLIPYVQFRRPMPRSVPAWLAGFVIVLTVVTSRTAITTDMAETWGMILLGIAGLDLVDRGILDRNATTSAVVRWVWYAFLVIAPIAFSVAEYRLDAGSTGIYGGSIRFLVRITEAFVFALFVGVFFAVGLGRTGRGDRVAPTVLSHDDDAESVAASGTAQRLRP